MIEQKISNQKDYTNMVIHDMRNPANLIDFQLDYLAYLIGVTNNNNNLQTLS